MSIAWFHSVPFLAEKIGYSPVLHKWLFPFISEGKIPFGSSAKPASFAEIHRPNEEAAFSNQQNSSSPPRFSPSTRLCPGSNISLDYFMVSPLLGRDLFIGHCGSTTIDREATTGGGALSGLDVGRLQRDDILAQTGDLRVAAEYM